MRTSTLMTEKKWLACTDPQEMVRFLVEGKGSDRQLRLFGCACCRQVWDLLTDDCFRDAIDIAERSADGQASAKELATAKKVSGAALERNGLAGVTGPRHCALGAAWSCTRNPQTAAMYPLWVFTEVSERKWEVQLLREIFNNPFRPVTLDPAWLTSKVQTLAQAIYDDRAFERMPELADALAEAGCNNEDILSHCRGPGPHVPGCWVVDLVLGRE
jgi:hypothetical protein